MLSISFQAARQTDTANFCAIGTRACTPDGSEWVYAKATTALALGSVAIPAASVGVDTVSSSADGEGRIVYITEASAGWTPGAYQNAWVVVDDGTGVGQSGRIADNSADTLTLYPEFALATALSVTDSDITISQQWETRKSAITSAIQGAVGIAQVAFAASDFGFLLTRGVGSVLAGEALIVGSNFTTGDDTTGQVIKGVTAEGPFDAQNLGYSIVANAGVDQLALVMVTLS